jgi:hypothetical protein
MNNGLILQTKLQSYLQAANNGAPGMSEEIIQEAGERFKEVLRRTFNETRPDNFRISMSNFGRPSCQLSMERDKAPREKQTYAFRMKMLIGDLTELAMRAIIKGSGIVIEQSNQKVKLELGPLKIAGEYDDKIAGAIYDIKSSSSYGYRNKWAKGFDTVEAEDTFGYCSQLFGYAQADNARAGGWFVVNKETGEIMLCEAKDTPAIRKKHLDKGEQNVYDVINPDRPFTRCFTDEPEKFRKVPTGNRILGFACGFCDFKFSCWPGLKHLKAVKSESDNAPLVYYTVFNPESVRTDEEVDALIKKKADKKAKKAAA